MGEKKYLEILLRYREEGFLARRVIGVKWLIAMVLLTMVAIWCLEDESLDMAPLGWLLIGFLISGISLTIRLYVRMRSTWPLAEKYLNWELIEEELASVEDDA